MRYGLLVLAVLLTACGDGNDSSPRIQSAVDSTPPVITLAGDNPQIIAVGEAYIELGATATDNGDGDLTASIVIDASAVDSSVPGEYSVTYDVSDSSGNVAATVTRTVIYEDRTAPVITLLGDNPQVIVLGNPYVELGANASDNVDGDLTDAIVIDSSGVDLSAVHDYEVTYDVSDAAGNAATTVRRTVSVILPVPAEPSVSVEGDIKKLMFSWTASSYADYYRLLENADGHSGFTQVGDNIPAGTLTASRDIAVHMFDWVEAQYMVEACNVTGCSGSDVVITTDVMLDTIGHFTALSPDEFDSFGGGVTLSDDGKTLAVGGVYLYRFDGTEWFRQTYIEASNTDPDDMFGWFGKSVALSADGDTLAVGAPWEDSLSKGINGDEDDNAATDAGAVYLFRFDGSNWHQQAYIKASNTDTDDFFGRSVALSDDGNTLAVGANGEDSIATGINGDQHDNSAPHAGAAYLYRFDGSAWYQDAYIKASNASQYSRFGNAVALSADSNTLVVGAAAGEGAVYVFGFDGTDWYQQAYIKASNADEADNFGASVALSADSTTLAVGAIFEDSISVGIDGAEEDNSAPEAGAVYVLRFDGTDWYQQAYVKASNTDISDWFGESVTLSTDGNLLVVGAPLERSSATGINGDQYDNSAIGAGAAYLYRYAGDVWYQQSYIKASDSGGGFGSVSLSGDGNTLAVGAADTIYVY